MEEVLLVIHLFLAIAIIGLVLLQRSEGGGLGIGGGNGGIGGVATPQGTANLLTRATAICAAAFFCTSLMLGVIAGKNSQLGSSILEEIKNESAAIEQSIDKKETTPSAPISTKTLETESTHKNTATSEEEEPEIPTAPIAE